MDVDQPPQPHAASSSSAETNALDLIGGPFAVIESDPGVFTSLTRRLGINGLELVEMYDIEPWAVDHLNPHGLIFCFLWRKDSHRPGDFNDPAAERVWFANQLSDDACATHAILNVLFNCPGIDIGEELTRFRAETEAMSPVLRGLAITNSPIIRPAHNYLARPCDLRASLNHLVTTTFEVEAKKAKAKKKLSEKDTKPPPAKKAKTITVKPAKAKGKEQQKPAEAEEEEETYHFIGYVPAHGKVWELDGLKSGPLEVGELPASDSCSTSEGSKDRSNRGWMDVVRPALRMKMEKYGGSGSDGSNIRFSLLAIVDDLYQKASDELEFLKRDKKALEKRLAPGWEKLVDPTLYESSQFAFVFPNLPLGDSGSIYAKDFGSRRMQRDMEIMNMPPDSAIAAWQTCVQDALRAKIALEDEIAKSTRANTDRVKRTFDYEPFIRAYIEQLHNDGLLNALLDLDDNGNKKKPPKKVGKP